MTIAKLTRAGRLAEGPFRGLPYRDAGVIYADPATKFLTRSQKGQDRSPDKHYRTMTDAEILALPVGDLCREDAFLFAWTTNPKTLWIEKLMEHWGFRFSGVAFTWVKTNLKGPGFHIGTGYGTRQNTERCYLGRRGNPERMSRSVRELIFAPVREHSRKPPEAMWRIERLAGSVPKVELFSRSKRPNWWYWGDEAGKF